MTSARSMQARIRTISSNAPETGNLRLRAGSDDPVERVAARESAELHCPFVEEPKVPRALGQLLDDRRRQDLAAACCVCDARGQHDVLAVEVLFLPDGLPGVKADPDLDRTTPIITKLGRDRVADGSRTFDRAAGAGESDHEAVALRLDLEAA